MTQLRNAVGKTPGSGRMGHVQKEDWMWKQISWPRSPDLVWILSVGTPEGT
jgi:hypothetical protein